ncbi:MAG: SPOR domain-containing protein [Armatimonadota bacterium]
MPPRPPGVPSPSPRAPEGPAVTPGPGDTVPAGPLYRVQVGAFAARENADERVAALRADGFNPYVVRERGLLKVRVGAFRDRALAGELADRLRAKGYEVVIVF